MFCISICELLNLVLIFTYLVPHFDVSRNISFDALSRNILIICQLLLLFEIYTVLYVFTIKGSARLIYMCKCFLWKQEEQHVCVNPALASTIHAMLKAKWERCVAKPTRSTGRIFPRRISNLQQVEWLPAGTSRGLFHWLTRCAIIDPRNGSELGCLPREYNNAYCIVESCCKKFVIFRKFVFCEKDGCHQARQSCIERFLLGGAHPTQSSQNLWLDPGQN